MEDILVKKFIGKNADVIYSKMEKKGSFNIFCMLFSFIYFIYRKMYLIGLISYLIQWLVGNYVKNIFVSIICMIMCGFIFYPLYKIHITRKINKIKEKATTEEEINNMCIKKGGTSILSAIIIPLILIIILIGSLGMMIFDSAQDTINNPDTGSASNINNEYSFNGATIKYGDDWQQKYVEVGGKKYNALCEKYGDIVIICLKAGDISDGTSDYSLSSTRQELYDELLNRATTTYSNNGITISKQTYNFKPLFNNVYYEYHEIHKGNYARSYIILNSENNKAASLMILSDSDITDIEESKINEVLKNIDF